MCRSSPPNAAQLEVLLGKMFAAPEVRVAARHDPVPSLQGRFVIRHCAYSRVDQASNFDI